MNKDSKKAPGNLTGSLQRYEKGGLRKAWKPRYLSQKGTTITVFASEYEQTSDKIMLTFDLRDISPPTSYPKVKNAFVVTVYSNHNKDKTTHTFMTETPELYLKWVAGFSDWVSFLQKNPGWGGQSDSAQEQPLLSTLTPEELRSLKAETDGKLNSLTVSMAGLEKLMGFYGNDPASQQQTHLQLEEKRKEMNELLDRQRKLSILLSGDPSQRGEVLRSDLQIVEAKFNKNMHNFEALEKMAQHLPQGSSQLIGAQTELRQLSETIARLESQKQMLNRALEEVGSSDGPSSGIAFAEALYDFAATNPSELELRAGDFITVTEKLDENWWAGTTADGRKGIFPVTYVAEKQKPTTPPPTPTPVPTPAPAQPHVAVTPAQTPAPAQPTTVVRKAKALYAFDPQSASELGLAQGDIVTLIFSDEGQDWWSGKLDDGREGVFPSTYVEILPTPTLTPTPSATLSPTPEPQQQRMPARNNKPLPLPVKRADSAPGPSTTATRSFTPATTPASPGGGSSLGATRGRPLPSPKPAPQQAHQPQPPQQPKPRTAVALYDFVPESAQELALRAGDIITLTQADAGQEWWTGQLDSGAHGCFPATYVQLQ